jgi:phosphoribosylanthranilate isomerase
MSFIVLNENGKIELTEDGKTLPGIISLRKTDRTKDRSFLENTIKYIYYTYKLKGIFHNKLPDKRKEMTCNTYLGGMDWHIFENNKIIRDLIKLFVELEYTPIQQHYESTKKDIQDFQKYLSGIPYTKEIDIEVEIDVEWKDCDGSMNIQKRKVKQKVSIDNSKEKNTAFESSVKLFEIEKKIRDKMAEEEQEKQIADKRLFDHKTE